MIYSHSLEPRSSVFYHRANRRGSLFNATPHSVAVQSAFAASGSYCGVDSIRILRVLFVYLRRRVGITPVG